MKAVELTLTDWYTRTHDLDFIILHKLPTHPVRDALWRAWNSQTSSILKTYTSLMYKGLNANRPTGASSEYYSKCRAEIQKVFESAKFMIQLANDLVADIKKGKMGA